MGKKYWRKLPQITIKETVAYLIGNNLDEKLIKDNFFGNYRDK